MRNSSHGGSFFLDDGVSSRLPVAVASIILLLMSFLLVLGN
jgi:hypothetical protein